MDLLRTLTSALAHYDKDAKDNSAAASYRKAVRLTGQLASLVAAMGRVEAGKGSSRRIRRCRTPPTSSTC